MSEELINIDLELRHSSIIKVLGVGGGGSNAVNYMYQQGIKDVDFAVCNTDIQALDVSPVPIKLQIGIELTEGLGAGNIPERGKQAAMENLDEINTFLSKGTKMLFITTGMGGGTGTGAAPIIAKTAKDLGILTVAIVTIPFKFEGNKRINQAKKGIEEIKQHVDSLLIINNEKLYNIYGNLQLSNAFSKADDVLTTAAKSIAEIITVEGYVNVDFQDVRTVMTNSGAALMGSAIAEGETRAIDATTQAISSPLLSNNDINGAKNILINITSSKGNKEITMEEFKEITQYIQEKVGGTPALIWGNGYDTTLEDKICVTIIATGFQADEILKEEDTTEASIKKQKKPTTYIHKKKSPNKPNQQQTKIEFFDD